MPSPYSSTSRSEEVEISEGYGTWLARQVRGVLVRIKTATGLVAL